MSDHTATIEVKLKAFQIPDFVTVDLNPRHHGDRNNAGLPVAGLDHAALDALASQWLDDLYKKAGKRNPFVIRESEQA